MKKKFLPKTAIFQLGIHEKKSQIIFYIGDVMKKKYLKNSTKKISQRIFFFSCTKKIIQ